MYLTRGDLRTHMGHQSSLPQSDETADFLAHAMVLSISFFFFARCAGSGDSPRRVRKEKQHVSPR